MHHLRQKWFMWNAIMHRGILLRECFLLCIKWLNFCALYLQIESGGNREQSDHTTSSGNTKKKSNQLPVHVRISLDKAHMLIFLLVMLRTANTIQFHRKKVAELRQRGFSWAENKITKIVHLPSFVCFVCFCFFFFLTHNWIWETLKKCRGQRQYMKTMYPKYQLPAEYWRSYTKPQTNTFVAKFSTSLNLPQWLNASMKCLMVSLFQFHLTCTLWIWVK